MQQPHGCHLGYGSTHPRAWTGHGRWQGQSGRGGERSSRRAPRGRPAERRHEHGACTAPESTHPRRMVLNGPPLNQVPPHPHPHPPPTPRHITSQVQVRPSPSPKPDDPVKRASSHRVLVQVCIRSPCQRVESHEVVERGDLPPERAGAREVWRGWDGRAGGIPGCSKSEASPATSLPPRHPRCTSASAAAGAAPTPPCVAGRRWRQRGGRGAAPLQRLSWPGNQGHGDGQRKRHEHSLRLYRPVCTCGLHLCPLPAAHTWWEGKLKKAWLARSAMKHSSAVGCSR